VREAGRLIQSFDKVYINFLLARLNTRKLPNYLAALVSRHAGNLEPRKNWDPEFRPFSTIRKIIVD